MSLVFSQLVSKQMNGAYQGLLSLAGLICGGLWVWQNWLLGNAVLCRDKIIPVLSTAFSGVLKVCALSKPAVSCPGWRKLLISDTFIEVPYFDSYLSCTPEFLYLTFQIVAETQQCSLAACYYLRTRSALYRTNRCICLKRGFCLPWGTCSLSFEVSLVSWCRY